MTIERCPWALQSPHETVYHDTEWGVPQFDDNRLFEFLILETAQAGLSWATILAKREGYRTSFAQFNPEVVARFTQHDIDRLLINPAIVRNKRKINSAVTNARAFLAIQQEYNSFSHFIWNFVKGAPIVNSWKKMSDVPPQTPLSAAIAKELKKKGFTFVGSTTIYAFMQAIGMVNDHLTGCFRHAEVQNTSQHRQ